jgi:c-di-GMP-binding flagellar brake protein YcgR
VAVAQVQDSMMEVNEQFSGLGLSIGSYITIEAIASARKYQVQLIGYLDKRSILISSPLRDGREVLLENNTALAIRLLEGKKVCAFETKIIYRSSHPYTHYHLQFPGTVNTRQIRNSERVDTELKVSVDSDFDVFSDWPKLAYITNLSKTGARMTSQYSLGEKGHEIILMFDLDVSGLHKKLKIPCIIRNIQLNTNLSSQDQEAISKGDFVFGIQFMEMNDEYRLSLSSYIYENEHK